MRERYLCNKKAGKNTLRKVSFWIVILAICCVFESNNYKGFCEGAETKKMDYLKTFSLGGVNVGSFFTLF